MSSDVGKAAQGLEAVMVRRLLETSGLFRSEAAGADVRAGMFVDVLAEAVTRAGGFGLADLLAASLGRPREAPGSDGAVPADPGPRGLPGPGSGAPALDFLEGVPDRITSAHGLRSDPFTGEARMHAGVDFGAPEGTGILAARAGTVRFAGERGGYGLMVEIDHGGGVISRYAHASELLVGPGDRVEQGDPVARVGSTGRSTGPHLHLELRVDGRSVDPLRALKAYGERVD